MNVIAIRQRTDEVYPPHDDGGELGVISLKWLFAFLIRRWMLIASVGFVVFVASLTTILLQPDRYTATALLLVNGGQDRALSPEQMINGDITPSVPAVDSQLEVLRSEMLAGRLVDALNLASDPEWNPFLAPSASSAGQVIPGANQEQVRRVVVRNVMSATAVQRRGLTYAAEVSVTSLNPQRSAEMANGLVELFRQYQLEARIASSQRANEWLAARVQVLRADVQAKEAAAERYRADHGLISVQGALLTEQQTTQLQADIAQARADLAATEARYLQVQQDSANGVSGESIASVLNSGLVSNLRQQEAEIARRQADYESRYSPLHPALVNVRAEREDIRVQIAAEIGRILTGLRGDVDVARARLNTLETNMAQLRGELVGNNEELVTLRELEREAGAARSVYESFLQRFHEIAEQGSMRSAPAELVSAAGVPTGPNSPGTAFAVLVSLVLGLGIGLVAGFLAQALDEGFGDADEVERKLGIPALAIVPRLRRSELRELPVTSRHPAAYLLERQMSAFTEACRVLRTTILFAAGQPRTQVVAICSALPSEGKTTLSISLARVSALSGQRVLLVDCDLRRRSVKDVLDFEPPAGLLQVLAGEDDWRQVMYLDEATGMHVLPLSDSGFTPKDVFGGEDMTRLLDDVRASFDLIVLDCAPVLAVADTRVVVAKADCAVMVTRWQKTPVRAARSALQQLQNAGAHVRGVALNGVDRRVPGYYSYPVYEFRET